jgi:hypothetical protein
MLNRDEFLHHCIDGGPYWAIIRYAESVIEKHNCFISFRFDIYKSCYDTANRYVRWFIGYAEKGIKRPAGDVVSDLFHEIGHMMQQPLKDWDLASIKGSNEQLEREIEAWTIGEDVYRKSNLTINHDFLCIYYSRKEFCINDYKKYNDKI